MALLAAEAHHDEGRDQQDESADDAGDDEDRDLQVLDLLSLLTLRLERVERRVTRTPGEGQAEAGAQRRQRRGFVSGFAATRPTVPVALPGVRMGVADLTAPRSSR
jgi:hypothetical protein